MSAETNNDSSTYEEQLSDLESRLEGHQNDEALLAELGRAMRQLLAKNGDSEARIREILERRYDQGSLRPESYELVQELLTRVAAESGTEPEPPSETESEPGAESTDYVDTIAEEPYVQTMVIEQPGQDPAPVQAPPAPARQLQIGSVLRDRYLLKEQVAEGSAGTVFKALDRRLAEAGDGDPFVAIKIVNPQLAQNATALNAIQQEAAKSRCLSHPNIVQFIDFDRDDDVHFLVMEWIEGRSLAAMLDENRGNALDFDMATNIAGQVSRALSYAHQRGVVHADLKPGNIIITADGMVKLIDFGAARIRQKVIESKSRFDPDVVQAGTPPYSSMQVLTGEDPVAADDVFSLACLLYRLVAGYRVFGPRNAADAAQEGMEPQQPPELDDVQWQALRKALSYSRVTRFKSPQEFMTAFSRGQATKAANPAPAPKPEPPAPQAVEPPPSIEDEPVIAQAEPVTAQEPEPVQIGADETTQVALDTPMRAERDPIMFEPDEDEPRRSPWRLVVVGIILIMSVAVVLKPELIETLGLEDPLGSISAFVDDIATEEAPNESASADDPPEQFEELEALPETDVADTTVVNANDNVVEELVIDVEGGEVDAIAPAGQDEAVADDVQIDAEAEVLPEEPEPLPPPIDFSQLPEPTLLLTLADGTETDTPSASLTLREDSDAGIIDLVRGGDLALPYSVRFVETATSGNQSAWESGQYQFADDGLLVFDAGQPRARIELTMRSNPVREPDRDVTLDVVDVDDPDVVLASIRLTLEDDDQRSFEASLAPNTVGFAVNQVSVREFDPAVQVDVIRYRADNTAVEVSYTLTDVTATEGQDYFAPGISEVYFGPGQRTARILIPLGQDARPEQDEAFMLELDTPDAPADSEIYRQIAVMIRDDDS